LRGREKKAGGIGERRYLFPFTLFSPSPFPSPFYAWHAGLTLVLQSCLATPIPCPSATKALAFFYWMANAQGRGHLSCQMALGEEGTKQDGKCPTPG